MAKIYTFFNKIWRSIYAQLAFTSVIFIPIILLSYLFTRNLVYEYIVNRTDNIVNFERMKIEADLTEPSTALGIFSESVRNMMINGDEYARLARFFDVQSEYLKNKSENGFFGYNGFYGYFESIKNNPPFICGTQWHVPAGYNISERPWYKAALESNGDIRESYPYTDGATGQIIITFVRTVYDDYGNMLGIVCLDVYIDDIINYIIETALAQNGYGVLFSQELTILAHPYEPYIGKKIGDPELTFNQFENELMNGKEIFEKEFVTFDNKNSIAFIKKLSNGWYLGLITPKEPFYREIRNMTLYMTLISGVLVAALLLILIKLNAAKKKSEMESRYKSIFLANMSHEMRTPMNAIIGMSMIAKTTDDVALKDYSLKKIDDASVHLLGVINDILDMSKIEANKFELSNDEFNFRKMIHNAVNIVNFRIDEKQHNFILSINDDIPETLIGDDQRLTQVITNLLGNAVKFTDDKGLISLSSTLLYENNSGCAIKISVKDTGIGISRENQTKLFKSFQQADSNTNRKYGGTGLGLAICRNIIEMMGGEISVESEPGIGSIFNIIITLKRGHKNAENNSNNEIDLNEYSGIFKGRCILLAEDVEINREIITTLLKPTMAVIDCVENGLQAVEQFSLNPEKYDLILMDLQMPEMDGYDAALKIRNSWHPNGKMIPIIALSANVFREDIEKCYKTGMNGHIGKPVNIEDIINKLKIYLN
ncbi:MAG: ATP-binding protein [Treponema sp.]|nr:ATP-binding protein [Treponema sp.]